MTVEEALEQGRRDATEGRSRTHRRSGLLIWFTLFAGLVILGLVLGPVITQRMPTARELVLLVVLGSPLALVWRTRVVATPAGLRVVNFTRVIEIGWHEVAHVDVRASSLTTARMRILTIDRVGAPPVQAFGVLRMWTGLLGPGSAQMSVARQVWGRWVAERERVGASNHGPTTGER